MDIDLKDLEDDFQFDSDFLKNQPTSPVNTSINLNDLSDISFHSEITTNTTNSITTNNQSNNNQNSNLDLSQINFSFDSDLFNSNEYLIGNDSLLAALNTESSCDFSLDRMAMENVIFSAKGNPPSAKLCDIDEYILQVSPEHKLLTDTLNSKDQIPYYQPVSGRFFNNTQLTIYQNLIKKTTSPISSSRGILLQPPSISYLPTLILYSLHHTSSNVQLKNDKKVIWVSFNLIEHLYIESIFHKEGFESPTILIIDKLPPYNTNNVNLLKNQFNQASFILIKQECYTKLLNNINFGLNEYIAKVNNVIYDCYLNPNDKKVMEFFGKLLPRSNSTSNFLMVSNRHLNYSKIYKDYTLEVYPVISTQKECVYFELNYPIKKILNLISKFIKQHSFELHSNSIIASPINSSENMIVKKLNILKEQKDLDYMDLLRINEIERLYQPIIDLINIGVDVSYQTLKKLSISKEITDDFQKLMDSIHTMSSEIEADIYQDHSKFQHLSQFIHNHIKPFASTNNNNNGIEVAQQIYFFKVLLFTNNQSSVSKIIEKIGKIQGIKIYHCIHKLMSSNVTMVLNEYNFIIQTIDMIDSNYVSILNQFSIVIEFDLLEPLQSLVFSTFISTMKPSTRLVNFVPTVTSSPYQLYQDREYDVIAQKLRLAANGSLKMSSSIIGNINENNIYFQSINLKQLSLSQKLSNINDTKYSIETFNEFMENSLGDNSKDFLLKLSIKLLLVANEHFLQNQQLIKYLTEEYNVHFIERNSKPAYRNLSMIVLDERNSLIIINNINGLTLGDHIDTLLSTSLEFSNIYLVFEDVDYKSTPNKSNSKSFTRNLLSTCQMILEDRSLEIWSQRDWLLENESTNEKFLTTIPGWNSYSAQLFLTWVPDGLDNILFKDIKKLEDSRLFWLPKYVLKYTNQYLFNILYNVEMDNNNTIKLNNLNNTNNDIIDLEMEIDADDIIDLIRNNRENSISKNNLPTLQKGLALKLPPKQSTPNNNLKLTLPIPMNKPTNIINKPSTSLKIQPKNHTTLSSQNNNVIKSKPKTNSSHNLKLLLPKTIPTTTITNNSNLNNPLKQSKIQQFFQKKR
ncbi:NDT80/PhoG-like protein [Tieghemostelium lacteum]|uniref:NDT80/PhoG-like protein n=1 Tax=Tieghemostelium lacteum TaxID=361077 RepID=A0A151Z6U4_TIELA|nr:NDT80/PhoG-like protein [Tieghemostelium lacteum]|eukprot:KYQ89691.1 NDT80/PhoG-like protein [Tieghemostelium lacteum]